MKPKVFLTRQFASSAIEKLKAFAEVEMNPYDRTLTKAEIIKGVRGKEGLICLLTDPIGPEIMDANPNLKVISNFAVGYNNIDVAAATKRKMIVTNTPDVLTDSSADLAMALILAVARRIVEGDQLVRRGEWKSWSPNWFLGNDVHGAILGIIGLGRIGKAIMRRAKAFNMKIVYWNRTRLSPQEEQKLGINYLSKTDLLKQADFVSVNLAYNSETHHFINTAAFQLMKPSAYIINTARGSIINEKEMVAALENKEIAGAGLDVFENEPQIEPELLTMNNVVLMPHSGSSTERTREKMAHLAVDNLIEVLSGQPPQNWVNPF